ncbi:MAG: radical SAM protein, partial [Nitrospirae bacterium]|nr:radical SAM protein [Nitrospirota bacterium]
MTERDNDDSNLSNYHLLIMENKFAVILSKMTLSICYNTAVHKTAGDIRLPINRLHIELTNVCDFSCEFCPDSIMKRRRGAMSFEMLKSILDAAPGIASLCLFHVMGEPTLYPHLTDAVAYASNLGLDVCVTTNGNRMDV